MISTLFRVARTDLKPFDGRLGMAWRVAAQCAIASAAFMVYGIPLAAIGCYLIIFILKPDSTESTVMAVAISILVSLVVAMMFPLLHWTIDSPLLRMVVIAGSSMLFLYIGAASKLGPAANILALVIAFIMTLLSDAPAGEVATRGMLYAWLMTLVPMGVVVIFNMFLGRSSLALLQESLAERLQAAADVLDGKAAPTTLERFLWEGNETLNKNVLFTRLLHLAHSSRTQHLKNAVIASYRLLLAVTRLPAFQDDPSRRELAARCRAAALAMRSGHAAAGSLDEVTTDDDLRDVREALTDVLKGSVPPQRRKTSQGGFFFPDALSNPVYQHYALRTTAAAIICYLIYTALDWQDIHTAMITCYVAALGSTAETLHKLFLRIVGCLIGAAMGMASIVFVIPYITSVGALMVLVFAGILVAGWVAAGSERIAYAGIQIGLAFLLTVLQGFGPDVQMDVAWDRIIGILLGNVVMFIMYTRMWPVGTMPSVTQGLSRALSRLNSLAGSPGNQGANTEEIAETMALLNKAREGLQMMIFEPRKLRPSGSDVALLKDIIGKAGRFCHLLAFDGTRRTSEYGRALNELQSMTQAVKRFGS